MARRLKGATLGAPAKSPISAPSGKAPGADSPTPEPARGAFRSGLALPPDWLPIALVLGDALIAAGSVPFAYWIRYGKASQTLPFGPYLAAIPIVIFIYLFSLAVNHQYSSWRGRTLADQLLSLYTGIGVAAVVMLAAIEIGNLGQRYSRLTFVPAILFSLVLMTGERYLLRQYETRLRRLGIGTERVLMVGTSAGSEILIRRMNMFPQYGFHVVGVVADQPAEGNYFGVPVVGTAADLPRLIERFHVDQVFLALPGDQRDRLLHLIKLCEDKHVEFKIVPDLLEAMSTRVAADAIDGLPLVGIRRSQLRGTGALVKRALDIMVSAVLLVLVSPLLAAVALLIRFTMPGGPILFRQERIGKDHKPFVIFKFRSMIPNAEAKTGPVVAKPGDERVTWLGRLMRRASIDELPQLYNVLRGDMSLVGPRPQPTYFDERYRGEVPRYLERQQARPGLTGWAEVNDLRGAAPIGDRTMYDVYYIEHWSLVLDLKIILLTALRLFSQRHAY